MKKLIEIVCAIVFIVIIFGTNSVMAQRFEGHGLSNINVQRQMGVEAIKSDCYKVVFGTAEEAQNIIRGDLKNVPCAAIQDALYQEIATQMQDEFNPDMPGDYDMTFNIIYTNTNQWRDFCKNNVDGYIRDVSGKVNFIFGNPAKSWVSENKPFRIVATITKRSSGKSARIFADCLNPIHSVEYGTQTTTTYQQSASNGPYIAPTPVTQTVSVVVNKPNPYQDLDERNAIRHSSGCPKWVLPVAIGTAAAIVVAVICLHHHQNSTAHDNVYNNGFQGGSGSSGASGGQGGQQTW